MTTTQSGKNNRKSKIAVIWLNKKLISKRQLRVDPTLDILLHPTLDEKAFRGNCNGFLGAASGKVVFMTKKRKIK